jgi:N-carbamoyl-L-amino-acid hydrolase
MQKHDSSSSWISLGIPDPAWLFERLRELTADTEGVTRAAYLLSESAAHDFVADIAREHGLEVSRDRAANLVMTLPGRGAAPPVFVGSHLDSVPQGGNYDGAAGVLAGLLCLIRLRLSGLTPPRTIKLIAFRGEESPWFNVAWVGSRALFGELGGDLERTHRQSGRTMRDHLAAANADVEAIAAGRRLLQPEEIAAFYELHIEQGPVMIERDAAVGIVSGIRGILRIPSIVCSGEEGHSGAVPRELRRDAVAAVVELLHRLDTDWRKLLAQGHDIVVTSGVLSTNPRQHSASRIAGEITFSLDVRSLERAVLDDFQNRLKASIRDISHSHHVSFELGSRYLMPPETMDPDLRRHLHRAAEHCGVPVIDIASGSGHDAMVFARNGVPSAMIFVRNQNGSHNPREAMEIADFLKAADVLYHALADAPVR